MQGSYGSDTPLALTGPHMIAMNLYNNAYLMPRIIHQMLSLLATLPHGTAFLSIYESNSGDSTGESTRRPCQWLHGAVHLQSARPALCACEGTVACGPADGLRRCRGVASSPQTAPGGIGLPSQDPPW